MFTTTATSRLLPAPSVDEQFWVKPAFHDADTDTDILARVLADTSDTRDFLNLFMCKLMSVSVSASWNAGL